MALYELIIECKDFLYFLQSVESETVIVPGGEGFTEVLSKKQRRLLEDERRKKEQGTQVDCWTLL